MLKLINLIENDIDQVNQTKEDQIQTRLDYAQKEEIGRSTLYSFDGTFQLMHADVANLQFLGKSSTTPDYPQLIVDLYSSKVYVCPMRSRKQILQRLKQFYEKIQNLRKKTCNHW